MLETKNLCKTYKPKKGVPVMAVDHVSLRFPERGMVFLLGKSGSGKSTMLNLLGGLDQYDDGEIIIKGISSKDFSQQRFDSYRNTYVGFIFQEYNVLEEFSVAQNIALALELQGRTATDELLNPILQAVDLEGFGARKPNELSGGQKQRVAIARALVKNPEIIMADEPTGALDSATGRQVLDTLKKLSQEKLVIIVSHDREYAEQYADRIIELADGQVIRDVEAVRQDADSSEKSLIFRASTIEIPPDYHLTEEDRAAINAYLDQLRTGASLTLPSAAQRFRETDVNRIPLQDGSKFHLIKSKLPMRSAFKIGCSSLKHKRFRLVMTILLSCAAFTLFSLVDTFSSYDHIRACTDSLIDSDVNYISVNKAERLGKGIDAWYSTYGMKISEADMQQFEADTGIPVTGLFIPPDADMSLSGQYDEEYEFTKGEYVTNLLHFCGYAEITEQRAAEMGFKLAAGTYPDGSKNEIAVSTALADTFVRAGYRAPDARGPVQKLTSPVGLVGKVIRIMDTDYTVSGVLDTGFDLSRYERLREEAPQNSASDELLNYLLYREFSIGANYSLTGCAMVGEGKLAELIAASPHVCPEKQDAYFGIGSYTDNFYVNTWANYYTDLAYIDPDDIVWVDGEKTALADNEVILPLQCMEVGTNNGMSEANTMLSEMTWGKTEVTEQSVRALLDEMKDEGLEHWQINCGWYNDETNQYDHLEDEEAEVVGFIRPDSLYANAMVISQKYAELVMRDTDGVYDSAICAMPDGRSEVEQFVRFCYRDGEDVPIRYNLNHAVTYELDTVNGALKVLAKVFLYIGIGFAVFAALLMANFITTSIHYKRQEIGILRAIGSRSADVFRIFFSESFVIAMINFVLSSVLCAAAVAVINTVLRTHVGVLLTVLHFGVRQMALLVLLSVGIAAAASFLPVHRIASKRPIDAIRDK